MINVSEYATKKDTADLCLPFIRIKDLSERDLRRRRDHIKARLLDEERICNERVLRQERKLREKEENHKFLNDERNYIWDKEIVRLPPICPTNQTFPTTKPYLTLFDSSTYRFPILNELHKKDLLLRFNTRATIGEVEKDFHPNHDCGVYRRELENQMRNKSRLNEQNLKYERRLDELMIKNYPFGDRKQEDYRGRFHRIKVPLEQGDLDDGFFPWCTGFGKNQRERTAINKNFEPIICKTKTNYIKMD